jgi:hypothetical protein
MEILKSLIDTVKSIFGSNVTTHVNVVLGRQGPPTEQPQRDISQSPPARSSDFDPKAQRFPPSHGSTNPIDKEALSEFIAELKYQKRKGDNIRVRLGKEDYDLDEIKRCPRARKIQKEISCPRSQSLPGSAFSVSDPADFSNSRTSWQWQIFSDAVCARFDENKISTP